MIGTCMLFRKLGQPHLLSLIKHIRAKPSASQPASTHAQIHVPRAHAPRANKRTNENINIEVCKKVHS